jgi:hypothetical protein
MSGPLSKAFLKALADTFDEAGRAAVRHVRDHEPAEYASVFAQMFPKETTPSDIYSDAPLDRLCDAIAAKLEKAVRTGSRPSTRPSTWQMCRRCLR